MPVFQGPVDDGAWFQVDLFNMGDVVLVEPDCYKYTGTDF